MSAAEIIRKAHARNLARIAKESCDPDRRARLKGSHNPSDVLFTRGEVECLLRDVRDTMLKEANR